MRRAIVLLLAVIVMVAAFVTAAETLEGSIGQVSNITPVGPEIKTHFHVSDACIGAQVVPCLHAVSFDDGSVKQLNSEQIAQLYTQAGLPTPPQFVKPATETPQIPTETEQVAPVAVMGAPEPLEASIISTPPADDNTLTASITSEVPTAPVADAAAAGPVVAPLPTPPPFLSALLESMFGQIQELNESPFTNSNMDLPQGIVVVRSFSTDAPASESEEEAAFESSMMGGPGLELASSTVETPAADSMPPQQPPRPFLDLIRSFFGPPHMESAMNEGNDEDDAVPELRRQPHIRMSSGPSSDDFAPLPMMPFLARMRHTFLGMPPPPPPPFFGRATFPPMMRDNEEDDSEADRHQDDAGFVRPEMRGANGEMTGEQQNDQPLVVEAEEVDAPAAPASAPSFFARFIRAHTSNGKHWRPRPPHGNPPPPPPNGDHPRPPPPQQQDGDHDYPADSANSQPPPPPPTDDGEQPADDQSMNADDEPLPPPEDYHHHPPRHHGAGAWIHAHPWVIWVSASLLLLLVTASVCVCVRRRRLRKAAQRLAQDQAQILAAQNLAGQYNNNLPQQQQQQQPGSSPNIVLAHPVFPQTAPYVAQPMNQYSNAYPQLNRQHEMAQPLLSIN